MLENYHEIRQMTSDFLFSTLLQPVLKISRHRLSHLLRGIEIQFVCSQLIGTVAKNNIRRVVKSGMPLAKLGVRGASS